MTNQRITWQKILWLLLAYATLAIGLIGAVLPILPTTPFLLIAVWAGSHASSRFKWWLLRHKHFGPGLRNWYRDKAIARPAKLLAVTVIVVSWLVIILSGSPSRVVAFTGLLFIGCISFLLSRPNPSNSPR
jgi:uncharacterized membrane protein YbaN (DUF454 family)